MPDEEFHDRMEKKERANDLLLAMMLVWRVECHSCGVVATVNKFTFPGMLAAAELLGEGWVAEGEKAICPQCSDVL